MKNLIKLSLLPALSLFMVGSAFGLGNMAQQNDQEPLMLIAGMFGCGLLAVGAFMCILQHHRNARFRKKQDRKACKKQ